MPGLPREELLEPERPPAVEQDLERQRHQPVAAYERHHGRRQRLRKLPSAAYRRRQEMDTQHGRGGGQLLLVPQRQRGGEEHAGGIHRQDLDPSGRHHHRRARSDRSGDGAVAPRRMRRLPQSACEQCDSRRAAGFADRRARYHHRRRRSHSGDRRIPDLFPLPRRQHQQAGAVHDAPDRADQYAPGIRHAIHPFIRSRVPAGAPTCRA